MGFRVYLMEKIQTLIRVYYQLHDISVDYLKSFWTNWTFLDFTLDEIYDKIISIF